MLHWHEQLDTRQFIDDRNAPPLRQFCAYCGREIAPGERRRHVSVNFQGPDCQRLALVTQKPPEVKNVIP